MAPEGRTNDGALGEAERVYCAWLAARERDEAPKFEDLCRSRPELQVELRDLHRDYGQGERLLRGLKAQGPGPELLGSADGRYQCRGEIAHGGMGVVEEVWDSVLRRSLARKRLLAGDRNGSAGLERAESRLLHEAQVLAQLEHPGIVPVHDVGLGTDGRIFLTMLRVRGQGFDEIVRAVHAEDSDWTLPRAVGLLQRVCETVAYAHSKGVLHRDLKPSNVMVGRFGEAYVMDWGLAKARGGEPVAAQVARPLLGPTQGEGERLDDGGDGSVRTTRRDASETGGGSAWATLEGDVVGTPAYMAPEQAGGRLGEVDERSDVYGAGAMLYHLLAGRPPYAGSPSTDPRRILEAVRAGPPRALEQVAPGAPAELVSVCARAMARERSERYPSMEALRDDLRAWLEGRVVGAHAGGWLSTGRKWVRRNRILAAFLLSIVLSVPVVAGLTTFGLAQRRAAGDNLRLFELMRHRTELDVARSEAETFHPSWPETLPALRSWVEIRGKPLESALEDVRKARAQMRESASDDSSRHLEESTRAFLVETLASLEEELRLFVEDPAGTVADVRQRIAWAERVEELSITRYRDRWEEARAAIARADGVVASELYRAHPIDLAPQMGLVPIGMNPATKLWEFHHLRSALDPERIPRPRADGTYELSPDTGIVFVLVPGGTFRMGSSLDPEDPNFDPQSRPRENPMLPDRLQEERPANDVTLEPFFLARCELTEAQIERLCWHLGQFTSPATAMNPASHVTPAASIRCLGAHGLLLPTEAQWEYAARARTHTPWWPGDRREDLIGVANVADASAARTDATWIGIEKDLDDGFPWLAPVGSLRPNPWGFHDVHGNVFEWTRDHPASYESPPRPGDGLRPPGDESNDWIARGGDYTSPTARARVAFRFRLPDGFLAVYVGLRAARALLPPE